MDILPFFKSLYSCSLVEIHAHTPDELQKEIAEDLLSLYGQFKDGVMYLFDSTCLSRITSYDLSETLPFTETEILDYLTKIETLHLNTQYNYNGLYVLPDSHWTIGGIYSIFKDIVECKISCFTFTVKMDFDPYIKASCTININLFNNKEDGFYMKVIPDFRQLEDNIKEKKYTGYYASDDGSIDASVVINKFNLNFNRGNIIKYVIRAGKKDPVKEIEDLEKARDYINFEIARIKGE